MGCSMGSTSNQQGYEHGSKYCERWGKKGRWSGMNLIVMIMGFVFFWPVGLVMVFWIASGRHVQELPGAVRDLWERTVGSSVGQTAEYTDNSVFNAYQQTQWDRISEIKDEIKARAQRFAEFRSDAKRRADDEEFNRFMNDAPKRDDVRS